MIHTLSSSYRWLMRRLVVVFVVSVALGGVAESSPTDQPVRTGDATRQPMPEPTRAASRADRPTDGAMVQVAAAASAAQAGLHGPIYDGETHNANPEPPAFVLFVAALLAIVFISTRRRKDR